MKQSNKLVCAVCLFILPDVYFVVCSGLGAAEGAHASECVLVPSSECMLVPSHECVRVGDVTQVSACW